MIPLRKDTRELLKGLARKGETYDELIRRLLLSRQRTQGE